MRRQATMTNGRCSSSSRRWSTSRWWWPMRASPCATACSSRRAPSPSSSSLPRARPRQMLERHARRDADGSCSGVDDGNMDSTLRSEEYAALVLPELDNLRAAYAWAAGEGGDRAVAIALAAHAGPLIDYSSEFAEWLLRAAPASRPRRGRRRHRGSLLARDGRHEHAGHAHHCRAARGGAARHDRLPPVATAATAVLGAAPRRASGRTRPATSHGGQAAIERGRGADRA